MPTAGEIYYAKMRIKWRNDKRRQRARIRNAKEAARIYAEAGGITVVRTPDPPPDPKDASD